MKTREQLRAENDRQRKQFLRLVKRVIRTDTKHYVARLVKNWAVRRHSVKLEKAVTRVLLELTAETLLFLWKHPKLQVEIQHGPASRTWAYFPAYQKRFPRIKVKPQTRVFLLISAPSDNVSRWPQGEVAKLLRHHLGHALLYLRKPKAQNECLAADREWRKERLP